MKNIFRALLVAIFSLQTVSVWAVTTDSKKDLLAIGAQAPDFSLTDVVSGKTVSLADFAAKKVLVVMIVCKHCPFVVRVTGGIGDLAKDYGPESEVGLVAISASDPAAYPEDSPESLKKMAEESGWTFPLLFDKTQAAAKAYTAVATPDFFVFDQDRKLVYRGQMDDARPNNEEPVSGRDLRAAIESAIAGTPVETPLKTAVGCSIKWKKGNEPAYW